MAASICVFIQTNPFKESPQYQRSVVVPMSQPTDDTVKLVNAATRGLREIYRMGFGYKKSGVLLMGLQSKGAIQVGLFDAPIEQAKSAKLMQVMDSINRRMGGGQFDDRCFWDSTALGDAPRSKVTELHDGVG